MRNLEKLYENSGTERRYETLRGKGKNNRFVDINEQSDGEVLIVYGYTVKSQLKDAYGADNATGRKLYKNWDTAVKKANEYINSYKD